MHLETLRIYCDIVNLGSFSKTAQRHHLSQSAVSQQLAQLESIHKCQLINRKKRPLDMTASGKLLYKAAKDMLERYELVQSELKTLKSSSGLRLKIAAVFSIGMYVLPEYVKRFMVSFPNINIHIEFLRTEQIYEQVLSGHTDIGLIAVAQRDKALDVYDFESEPLVLVCSPKHALAVEQSIDISRLQFERFIAFAKDMPTRIWIDSIFARYNLKVRPAIEFDNIETIKQAIEVNAGVSILPSTAITQEMAAESVCAIGFTNEQFVRPTGIILRRGKVLSQAGQYMIELLRKELSLT